MGSSSSVIWYMKFLTVTGVILVYEQKIVYKTVMTGTEEPYCSNI